MTNIEKWLIRRGFERTAEGVEGHRAIYRKKDIEVKLDFDSETGEINHDYLSREVLELWDAFNSIKDPWEESK